jgi:hypothetical protein
MQEMIIGYAPGFDEVLERIASLEKDINQGAT